MGLTVLMIGTIIILAGCTQFDKSDRKQKEWNVRMEAPVEGGCFIAIDVRGDDEIKDDTIDFKHPNG